MQVLLVLTTFIFVFLGYLHAKISTEPLQVTTVLAARIKACPKCGTTKYGKLTCCARGGSWFQKCGDLGDRKFEHTWAEGIQACTNCSSSLLVKTPAQDRRNRVMSLSMMLVGLQHDAQHDANAYRTRNVSNTGTAYCADRFPLAKVTVLTSGFLINLCL